MTDFYKTKVDYFYGDGINLAADEIFGTSDHMFRSGDTIEITEYDRERGEYTDIYKITEIKPDEDDQMVAYVMFLESDY